MQNFIVCLNAVLPIFISLAAGFAARLCGVVKSDDTGRVNRIAFNVFMPVMVFYNIYNSDIGLSISFGLLFFAVAGVLSAFAATTLLVYRFEKIPARRGVLIQGVCRSNFVIIGLPIALSLLGDVDMGMVAILLAVVVPIYNVLAVIALTVNNGIKPDVVTTLRNIAKNPLIIGTLIGILFSALHLKLPVAAEKVVKDFSSAASPLLLFILGAFFDFSKLRYATKALFWAVSGRLIVLPGIMLTLGYMLGFRGIEFVSLIGVFASPTAVASFAMAQQMGGDERLAGNIVVMSSALCSFTLFLWCFIFKTLGAF